MIDQRKLPDKVIYLKLKTYRDVIGAIKKMVVRGAPAIGVSAAFGLYIGAKDIAAKMGILSSGKNIDRRGANAELDVECSTGNKKKGCRTSNNIQTVINYSNNNSNNEDARDYEEFKIKFLKICDEMFKARPTAVNLEWAIKKMKKIVIGSDSSSISNILKTLREESVNIYNEDIEINKKMGKFGASLINDGSTILTHCNAGALATAGYGTALGVIRAAIEDKKKIKVIADETRPFLQGARLTAWELMSDNIPVTLIADNSAGLLMRKGMIDGVIVGADRIASNGDVANKIGTYQVAVLAKENNIPFYVAAPLSTIDLNIKSGEEIPIEERDGKEVSAVFGKQIAPENVDVLNYAFDITPNKYISAIITEEGIAKSPYNKSIAELFKKLKN
ncbi:MAG: S-methyl-5-thioribose-1-phosphate isomerase [Candidatus Acididesulfobacter guangdongensis]|uniref:Methylthioribose-1-phosphate isomerase n=1 Tax=Acididesulfobacter guangdongensis TaxID=2597225 RepID=A0A519BH97_ACIG2|nr:MAG: S-methyl-5-thioribose-1-phosphate isomerase [Candidatus Acididesulfobacter guangdongensis]